MTLSETNTISAWTMLNESTLCKHVYQYQGIGPCGYCGLDTHDPNWIKINEGYKKYKEKVGYFYNTNKWWSI